MQFLKLIPNQVWIGLLIVALWGGTYLYAYNKGSTDKEIAITSALQKQKDKEINDLLTSTSEELKRVIDEKEETEKRVAELQKGFSKSHIKIQELEKDLQDANETTDPNCSVLPPARLRLYQNIYNQIPTSGKD